MGEGGGLKNFLTWRGKAGQGKDPGEAFEAGVDIKEWIVAGLPPGLKI